MMMRKPLSFLTLVFSLDNALVPKDGGVDCFDDIYKERFTKVGELLLDKIYNAKVEIVF